MALLPELEIAARSSNCSITQQIWPIAHKSYCCQLVVGRFSQDLPAFTQFSTLPAHCYAQVHNDAASRRTPSASSSHDTPE
jgi:hypothetical protein